MTPTPRFTTVAVEALALAVAVDASAGQRDDERFDVPNTAARSGLQPMSSLVLDAAF